MSDDNDDSLTKPKKPRSDAQKAAYEKMVAARSAKMSAKPEPPPKEIKMTPTEKKLRLQAIKEQLAGKKAEPVSEDESEEEVAVEVAPLSKAEKIKKEKKETVDEPIMRLPKKEPKIIYQSASEDSESEEEVIIVKKKKKDKSKKKRKTIIYEESSSEEEEPIRKERETKTQKNAGSKFKVTPSVAEKPKGPIYYFAD